MVPALSPLAGLLDLNGDLLVNCVEGVSEADACRQVCTATNSLAFLVAHLVDARYFLAAMMGAQATNPLAVTLADVKSIEDGPALPSLAALKGMWADASAVLRRALDEASPQCLAAPSPHHFPVTDGSVLGGVAFLAQHESYHIGQLSLVRRCLGYAAMSYRRQTPDAEG